MVRTENEITAKSLQYVELVKKAFYVKQAYLFGSFAKNSANENSDIDIAIVSPDFENLPDNVILKILFKMARHIDSKIEPLALTENEIATPLLGSVTVDILKEGKLIYSE